MVSGFRALIPRGLAKAWKGMAKAKAWQRQRNGKSKEMAKTKLGISATTIQPTCGAPQAADDFFLIVLDWLICIDTLNYF